MIPNTQKQYAFQIIDTAAPPDKKGGLHRVLMVTLSVFVTGFLMMAVILVQDGVRQHGVTEENASS